MISVPQHDYVRSRNRADMLVRRWGNVVRLRRPGIPDRDAMAGITQYTAAERIGQVLNPNDLHCVMSALDPSRGEPMALPPTNSDILITFAVDQKTGRVLSPRREDQSYRIVSPVVPGAAPSGLILFWEMAVRKY